MFIWHNFTESFTLHTGTCIKKRNYMFTFQNSQFLVKRRDFSQLVRSRPLSQTGKKKRWGMGPKYGPKFAIKKGLEAQWGIISMRPVPMHKPPYFTNRRAKNESRSLANKIPWCEVIPVTAPLIMGSQDLTPVAIDAHAVAHARVTFFHAAQIQGHGIFIRKNNGTNYFRQMNKYCTLFTEQTWTFLIKCQQNLKVVLSDKLVVISCHPAWKVGRRFERTSWDFKPIAG